MPDAAPTTPLLEQYEGVKAQYPGHLVLFRVGDFYETFGEDARLLSRELDVVLTARAPDTHGERTPMAGVPHHAVETYLGRLVRKGYKVALCDQVEDARFAKGLVRREVTRVVTPGTVLEDRILGGPDHSFLASVVLGPEGIGEYAAVDITTGEWLRGGSDGRGPEGLISALAPLDPREVLYAVPDTDRRALTSALRREFPAARLESAPAPLLPSELPASLAPPGIPWAPPGDAELRLAAYLRATQPRVLPHLARVDRANGGPRLVLDPKTLRHLEITRPMNPDDPNGATLLRTWDESVTAAGHRTLAFWLANPLAEVKAVRERQDEVEALLARGAALAELRAVLREFGDLGRIATRVAGRRVRVSELGTLRASLRAVGRLREFLRIDGSSDRFRRLDLALASPPELLALLESALPDPIPPGDEEGNRFREGHLPDVDRWRAAERAAVQELSELERSEQEATGIKTLKIGYNQVFGYYLEVTRPNLSRVPERFRRRQTVAQAERFTSDRLEEVERRILEARERLGNVEAERWEEFLATLDRSVAVLQRLARGVGELDALATFAHLARTRGYRRPEVDDGAAIVIREGRHPVLDRGLGEAFVPNDTELDLERHRLIVLTGPNMSGKSTYMRQIGLLVVLAQAGSFVPARFARIGLVTQLFTRMGFTDEIGLGKSSFMVEMSEVAEILRRADARSLVLLDEVGRGTSTFDGLAIAWATLRYLHDTVRVRSVLATHYHQLTDLIRGLSAAENAHLAVEDRAEGVVFLHRLVPGSTDKSYGVHVARLAGLPEELLAEAERLLGRLEREGVGLAPRRAARARGPRYTQAVLLPGRETAPDPILQELGALDVDRLTPEEAAERLREWKRRASGPAAREDASR